MNTLTGQFKVGIKTWFASWGFIFRNGLAHYFIYPFIISILLGMGAIALINMLVENAMGLVTPHLDYQPLNGTFWENLKNILADISIYAIGFVVALVSLFTTWKVSKYLTLAVMSPVMAFLSERVDSIVTGNNFPFNGQQLVRDIFRGIALALRNLFMELILVWGIMFINFIITLFFPPLLLISSLVSSVLIFFIGAYFYGFSTLDYTNERRKRKMSESIRLTRKYKGVAAGNGTIFSLFFIIPLIGTSIATITCTVAATLAMNEIDKFEKGQTPTV